MKIELKHITKSYKAPVIKDLTYTFEAGKLYVIKGVSGCGKTTLLNLIGGVDRDFHGEIAFDGGKLAENSAYVFQSSLLLSNITVRENLLLIKNSPEEVSALCEKLHVGDLLNKYPAQLSGGERQRIAVVRALSRSPKVLLADEPTASLDDENSANIAKTIANLRDPGRIVIVATHEHYFDGYADEIIHLRYGVIERVDRSEPVLPPPEEGVAPASAADSRGRFSGFGYAMKRNPKLLRPGSLCLLVMVFLLVMLISTVQNNIADEYERYILKAYPADLIICNPHDLDDFPYKDKLKSYDDYIAMDGEVTAYHLLDKKDSVLAIDGMILEGKYPEGDREILVSSEFVRFCFGENADFGDCLGKTVSFKGMDFVISGVTVDPDNDDTYDDFHADIYYQRNTRKIKDNLIFIPYDILKTIGEVQDLSFIMRVYDHLHEDKAALNWIRENFYDGNPNYFYDRIDDAQGTLDGLIKLFVLVLLISYVISCLFMVSIVQTELFYRKKELGYLQIFGLSKKRISGMVFSEYLLKVLAALGVSAVLYLLVVAGYGLWGGVILWFEPIFTLGIIAILTGIYLATAYLSIRRFLRRSVVNLIT